MGSLERVWSSRIIGRESRSLTLSTRALPTQVPRACQDKIPMRPRLQTKKNVFRNQTLSFPIQNCETIHAYHWATHLHYFFMVARTLYTNSSPPVLQAPLDSTSVYCHEIQSQGFLPYSYDPFPVNIWKAVLCCHWWRENFIEILLLNQTLLHAVVFC